MVCGTADTALADGDARSSGQQHIDQRDLVQLGEDLARLIAQAGTVAPHAQGFPKDISQETDQDVGLYALFLLVPDGPHHQVALVQPKGLFGLGQLDVGAP